MKSFRTIAAMLILGLTVLAVPAAGQSDLQIYGFFQASAMSYTSTPSKVSMSTWNVETFNFGIPQANLFFLKNIGDGFSGFVNLEFVNNYSSDREWGSFNLQEAFLRYDYADYLTIKAGYFIPQFNSMYEIYNRTPLLPYLFRPFLYETQMGQITNIFDVLPTRALVQVSGFIPVSAVKLDYALYLGSPADGFIESPKNPINPAYVPFGQNTTTYKSGGGRVGVRYGSLKAGMSYVLDVNSKRCFGIDLMDPTNVRSFGDLTRDKLGADFSYSLAGITLSGEYFYSTSDLSQTQKDSLKVWHSIANSSIGTSFDVVAYFVTLRYDINDQLFVYGEYDRFNDNFNTGFTGIDGFFGISAGGGYRVNENLVLKAQYKNNFSTYITDQGNSDLDDNYYFVGFSLAF